MTSQIESESPEDAELQHLDRPNGRDARGLFLKGHTLGGRPPRPDIYVLAREKAKAEGLDLEDALWGIVKIMLVQAHAGDVASAKLIFERLCVDPELAAKHGSGLQVLVVDTGIVAPPSPALPPSTRDST